jgi:molybdopterin converting factor small subunit
MMVTVRLFAQLKELVPEGRRPLAMEVAEGTTVLDIADRLGIGERALEIMVNNDRAHNAIRVDDGDVVSYFPALVGG